MSHQTYTLPLTLTYGHWKNPRRKHHLKIDQEPKSKSKYTVRYSKCMASLWKRCQDGIGEATYVTKPNVRQRRDFIWAYTAGGDFTVHNIRLPDFIVHHSSWNQLTSYISRRHCAVCGHYGVVSATSRVSCAATSEEGGVLAGASRRGAI